MIVGAGLASALLLTRIIHKNLEMLPVLYCEWFLPVFTVDGVPDESNALKGINLDMKPRPEPLGDTDGYQLVQNLSSAVTDTDFGCDWIIPGMDRPLNLSMRVLNNEPLEAIHGFEWSRQYSAQEKEFLLMSRKARNADFIVLFEPHRGESKLSKFERFEVVDVDGKKVNGALGARVTIVGKPYEVILNPDRAEVKKVKGLTRKVLSVEVERKD